jgi:CDP-diacylglycerol--serine O-phosphatidyltransferase
MVKQKIVQKIRTSNRGFFPLFRLLPNAVTITALCLALTAIKSSFVGDYLQAVSLLIVAGVLDGIDGRLARFLHSTSDFGAQLDSLADFANFGIIPPIIVYFWIKSYGDINGTNYNGLDWAMVMFFAICVSIRLARFNVDMTKQKQNPLLEKYFFKGIPSPVGAAMATLPIILSFEFGEGFYCNQLLVIFYVMFIAALMASKVPTISIKKIPIKNNNIPLTLVIIGSIIIGLITKPWLTLATIGIVYFISIFITTFFFIKISQQPYDKNTHN